jgi:tetratricopeptide (TPR) repeat protein
MGGTILRAMRPVRGLRRLLPCIPPVLLLCFAWAGCGASDPLEAAREQVARGEFQAALEPLRELIAERSGDPEVLYLYGFALQQLGQASLAEWSLREAMNDPKWLVPAGAQLIQGALLTNNFALAVEAADRVLADNSENLDVLLMRANAHAHSRVDPESALEDVERVLALDPDNIDVMEPKILSLLALERIDEAAAAIEALGERIAAAENESGLPDSSLPGWHCATAALFAEESDEMELAETRWADCVERYPAHLNVIHNGVNFYRSRGEHERSLEILRRGQGENPDSRELRVLLALWLRETGASAEAEDLLREATETRLPLLSAAAWIDLAKHHQELGDFAASARAAEAAHARAREGGPVPAQLLFEYADALVMAGELEASLAVADEIELPAYQEMIRARVAQEAGRPADALEHFERAFQQWPDNPFARYFAALAAEAVGDFDRAEEAYRYSIRISPGATDARERVARMLLAEGRPQDALYLLRLSADQQPLSFEGELLSLQLWARLARTAKLGSEIALLARAAPAQLGAAIAQAAQGLRDRIGPAAAVESIRRAESVGLDLTHPLHADSLRALVRFSREAGLRDEAEAMQAAALAAHPDSAVPHEVRGLWLELGGAAADAEAAYGRALELDSGNLHALRGIGRLSQSDPERALAYFDRALEREPGDPEALRGAAAALVDAGRSQQAEARLEALLAEHPYDAAAAAELARLQLQRDPVMDRSLELAERAVRFRGGSDALDLLSRIHDQRGEQELAARAAERARTLRESP